jgi:hypothetical protein
MAAAITWPPNTLPQRSMPNCVLEVTMSEACPERGGDELEEQVGGLGLERDVANRGMTLMTPIFV